MCTLQDLAVAGSTALVRLDLNVPLSPDGEIADDTRIRASLPTIGWLREHGAEKLVLLSHLGRPKGEDRAFSLRPVAERLSTLLDAPVTLLPTDLELTRHQVEAAPPGSVLLLENTRFYPGETKNDAALARQLAQLGTVFVQDAFGAVHRAHASTEGVARLIPSGAGLLVQREVRALGQLFGKPARPFVAVLGGAKVFDKVRVIENLLPRVDSLLIGGAMANTFLASQGHQMGRSLVEPDAVEVAASLLRGPGGEKVHLPADLVVAPRLERPEEARVVPVGGVAPDVAAYDVGPETVRLYSELIRAAATVFWNGPMGVFETPRFAEGTYGIARAMAACDGYTVVGGGDSVAALERSGQAVGVDHISTGGGASLEFLEGRPLPGLAVLGGVRA